MSEKPVAIITGGSRGIGRGIALQLAEIGYNLVINYVSNEEAAEEAAAQIESLGAACAKHRGDVSDSKARQSLKDITRETFGRADLLINNAGVAPLKRMDLLEATEESYDRVMRINLKGPYFLTQLIANWMIAQKEQFPQRQPRIVNIGSVSSYASSPARGEYCLSKAGMTMMTALYADRLAEYGIGTFEIQAGVIATDMTTVVKEKYDKLIADGFTPIKRWGKPQDIANAVAAIAEGRLDFATGQIINADGGFHIRRL